MGKKDKGLAPSTKKKTPKGEEGVHPHLAHVKKVKKLYAILNDPDASKKDRKAAKAAIAEYEVETAERVPAGKSREEFVAEGEAARKEALPDKAAKKAHKKKAEKIEKAAVEATETETTPEPDEPGEKLVEVKLDDEAKESLAAMKKRVKAKTKARKAEADEAGISPFDLAAAEDRLPGETEVAYQWRKKGGEKAVLEEDPRVIEHEKTKGKTKSAKSETTEVATEDGREFAVGTGEVGEDVVPTDDNKDPVTGAIFDPEMKLPVSNHKPPRPLVWVEGDDGEGKLETYTRVTSYIDVLGDKKAIADWRVQSALSGAATEGEAPFEDTVIGRTKAATETYAKALKKIEKLDRKGKLDDVGARAEAEEDARKTFKAEMTRIAEDAEEMGGTKVKSKLGTHLHHLTEVLDNNGMEYVIEHYDPSPSDLADLEAYRRAMDALGVEVIVAEKRVVNDEHKTTGTFDRGVFIKLPGASRRTKMIGDIKTGAKTYLAGSTAMQVREYAGGVEYDPSTHERKKLGYSTKQGLLIHLPAGEGRCTIYLIDLTKGEEGLRLAALVRAWRASTTEAQAFRGKTPFYSELLPEVGGADS